MSDFFKDGSRWGSIDSSGSIYASDGTYLGSLDKFGKFHDSSGTYMGSIDSQGKIRNYKGDYLGSVWSNGEVHNDRGDYIGMFPYYNGKIGQFQIGNNNDSTSFNNNSDYNNGNQTTGSSTTHTSTGGDSITPASLSSDGDILDVIKFVVIIIIGALIFSILSDCFYTVKELFISPYSSILLLLSLVAPAIAGTISKKENKINQIKTDYYDIENNLDSMESDSSDGATFYYRNNTLTKMVDTVYQDNYTVEVSYKNSKPFFIFMKSNDDNSEYRYYYFNGKLIRYIDENGEVSDYEDGTDIIGSDLYEWADAM